MRNMSGFKRMTRRSFTRWLVVGTSLLFMMTLIGPLPRFSWAAAGDRPIRIGLLASLTNIVGRAMRAGAEVASKEFSAKYDRRIELYYGDTELNPQQGVMAFQELVYRNKIDFVIGFQSTSVALAVMPRLKASNVIMMSSCAGDPDMSTLLKDNYDQYKYWFRTGQPNMRFYAEDAVRFLGYLKKTYGFTKVAILGEDSKWTLGSDDYIKAALSSSSDFQLVDHIRYPLTTSNFRPVLERIARAQVTIFTAGHSSGIPLIEQWHNLKVKTLLCGMNGQGAFPEYWGASGGKVASSVVVKWGTDLVSVTERTKPFAKAYKDVTGVWPTSTAFSTYDAILVIMDAVKRAGNVEDKDAVISALENTRLDGAGYPIEFYGKSGQYPHDVVYGEQKGRFFWEQWLPDGSRTLIYPDKYPESTKLQLPEWF